jgi:hypothetical protein
MKLRWIIMVGLGTVLAICGFVFLRPSGRARKAVEATRRTLHQQGFKTDLTEFNFSTSAELRNRAAPLVNYRLTYLPGFSGDTPDLLPAVGSNSALVVWKQDKLAGYSGEDLWPAPRQTLNADRAALDAACEAALSGPIRFDLNASAGSGMLLPHLGALKSLAQTLGSRAVLELHEQHHAAAWTNLLAATRLVTAWEPEPVEVSHLVRQACAGIAFSATWQVLQAGGWEEDRLAQLQHEWESVDFFKGLPETAAFTRASTANMCQLMRVEPQSSSMTMTEMLHQPSHAWYALTSSWQQFRYRHYGIYEDEQSILLHFRDRELELRRAVQSSTWSEMRQLPGVTNQILFQSKHHSGVQVLLNSIQLTLAWQGQGQGLLSRAAEAESRRRLIITALALERFRSRHGSYPQTLPELSPELLQNPPVDFMDGQPLRYHLLADGHFLLYSVGSDCIDNGGEMPPSTRQGDPYARPRGFANSQGTDLVWPHPASDAEIQAQEQADAEESRLRKTAQEEKRAQ